MVRRAAAIFIAVHGLIHLIGFVVPWKLAVVDGQPYSTSAFFGLLNLGEEGTRTVGVFWLGVALALVVAAVAIWQKRRWAGGWCASWAFVSAVLCVYALPATIAGLLADIAIVAVFALVGSERTGLTARWSDTQPRPIRPN